MIKSCQKQTNIIYSKEFKTLIELVFVWKAKSKLFELTRLCSKLFGHTNYFSYFIITIKNSEFMLQGN